MENPELFLKCNNLPRRDAKEFLEANSLKINWKTVGDRSLDIGSADGGVTMKILREYLPYNYDKLVGCDISKEMVLYANEHYGDERTYFVEHDIRNEVPKHMRGAFDHVFSSYTLHWIQNQRDVMSKIHTMLDDGGDCLLMILASSPIYAVYRLMSQQPKWMPWLSNAKDFLSPYQDSLQPAEDLREIMKDVGFKNVEVTCQQRSYLYKDVSFLKETMAGICPFRIPKDYMEEYLEDYVQTAVKHQLMEVVTDDNDKFLGLDYVYSLLWAYGSKL